MRKIVICLSFCSVLVACKEQSVNTPSKSSDNVALYKQAVKNEDLSTAIVALNYILLEDSTNLEYTDSLARLYLRNGVFAGGLSLAEKVLEKQPKNYKTMELVAEARGTRGEFAVAKKQFNELFEKFNDIRYLYKLAIIESEESDINVFMARLDQIIGFDGTAVVEYPAMQGMQSVDIKAVANLLKANVYFSQGNVDLATQYVKKALAISPNFQAGLIALEQIKEALAGGGAPSANSQKQLSKKDLERIREENYRKQMQRQ